MNLALVIKKETFEQLSRLREQYRTDTFDETIKQLMHEARK